MSLVKRFQTELSSLYTLPESSKYVIAYSGGVDSHVLLYCCAKLTLPIRAVHIHHGLQDEANDWVGHCQRTCEDLNVPLDIIYVNASKNKGQSPEESARLARYEALQANLKTGDCLLTGQHLDDQAETLLLQLFRTASSAGLSAMPACKMLGDNFHIRPLLTFSREEIERIARENALQWVEDPSNQDVAYDRNFIRKDVMPLLQSRWSEVVMQLSTVAQLQANNLQVLEDMAAIDLANCVNSSFKQVSTSHYKTISVLSISRLNVLTLSRLLNVLRYWIRCNGLQPTKNLLIEIEKTLMNSLSDSNPVIEFDTFEFRKFQDNIYLLQRVVDLQSGNAGDNFNWQPRTSVIISGKKLTSVVSNGHGIRKDLLDESLSISFRKGGEVFHPAERVHSQRLKKLLQEANLPPWDRDSIPLLYFNNELISVVGLWVSKDYSVGENEEGWLVEIESV